MEDIIIYRRKRLSSGQWKCQDKILLKVEIDKGRFVMFEKLAKLIGAKHGDAVMFGFSKKDKCAYIFKEDPEPDSYYIRAAGTGRPYYRFTAKDLAQYFYDNFQLEPEDKVAYFEAIDEPNEKGWYKLILES